MTLARREQLSKVMRNVMQMAWAIIKAEAVSKSDAMKRAWATVKKRIGGLTMETKKRPTRADVANIIATKTRREEVRRYSILDDEGYGDEDPNAAPLWRTEEVPVYTPPKARKLDPQRQEFAWVIDNWQEKVINPANVSDETKRLATIVVKNIVEYNTGLIDSTARFIRKNGFEAGVTYMAEVIYPKYYQKYLDFEGWVLAQEIAAIEKEEKEALEIAELTKRIMAEDRTEEAKALAQATQCVKTGREYISIAKMLSM